MLRVMTCVMARTFGRFVDTWMVILMWNCSWWCRDSVTIWCLRWPFGCCQEGRNHESTPLTQEHCGEKSSLIDTIKLWFVDRFFQCLTGMLDKGATGKTHRGSNLNFRCRKGRGRTNRRLKSLTHLKLFPGLPPSCSEQEAGRVTLRFFWNY